MTRADLVVFIDDEGLEHVLPTVFEVCPRCSGRGQHCNPNIDGHGLTADDFIEAGDDFRGDYMAGRYDVACHECGGLRVVAVVDRDRCPAALLAAYDAQQDELADCYAMEAAERRMGA
jgi:hypothetical protein